MSRDKKQVFSAKAFILVLLLAAVSLVLLLDINYNVLPLLEIPDDTGFVRGGLLAVVVICAVWMVLHLLGRLFERVVIAQVHSHAQARSIWKLISVIAWGVVLLALGLGLMGDVASTALSVGLVGAALAFVLQKPLLNVVGWVAITYRQMYRIGDRVSLGGVSGYVTDVRVLYTEVREFGEWMRGDTFTGRIVNVPNGVVFEGPVYNYTRDVPFVWDEVVNLVTYESDVDLAKTYMLEAAEEVVGSFMTENFEYYRSHLEVRDLDALLVKQPELRMEFSDSGVDLAVLYFCPAAARRRIRGEIVERIWRKFMDDPGVEIAYPHMKIVSRERHREAAEEFLAQASSGRLSQPSGAHR